jgi:glycosyltransferase involved in cell wall biosynthesis
MRILHLHSGNIYGGIETMLATLAREATAPASADVRFALCFGGRLADELSRDGAPVAMLGAVRLSRPVTVWQARRRLRTVLADIRPDVIVTHLPWTHAAFGTALRQSTPPVVQWVHGPLTGRLQWLAARSMPDAVLCNSAFTASTLPEAYAQLRPAVIHCAVAAVPSLSAERRSEVRASLSTNEGATVIVQASRFEAWKGHADHLRALARLAKIPGWVLWVAGGTERREDLDYRQSLQALADHLGIAQRIRFTGERSDVVQLLAAADIYCQPNTAPEPFGIVYVEALAAGDPVVATDLGGVREIVDRHTGILTKPGDEEALAAALGILIADPAARQRMGAAGILRAAHLCSPPQQVRCLERFLTDVVSRAA